MTSENVVIKISPETDVVEFRRVSKKSTNKFKIFTKQFGQNGSPLNLTWKILPKIFLTKMGRRKY